eukprot:TRINITY_DN57705_c0_g1_i3.p1 TRINITY_DN57705_c0_g1~~TRINITY_DN57705_c0_g1_i3.p1  ORF type:complete len:414 (-),score=51.56 TRINITY_DN57705_c0_g1_i3:1195-2436(-)
MRWRLPCLSPWQDYGVFRLAGLLALCRAAWAVSEGLENLNATVAREEGHWQLEPLSGDRQPPREANVLYVDESLCIQDLRVIHRLELRAAEGAAALSGVRFFLVRQLQAKSSGLRAFSNDLQTGPSLVPEKERLSRHTDMESLIAEESSRDANNNKIDGALPGGSTALLTNFDRMILANPGACLGWMYQAHGSGALAAVNKKPGDGKVLRCEPSVELLGKKRQAEFNATCTSEPATFAIGWALSLLPEDIQDFPRAERLPVLRSWVEVQGRLPVSTTLTFKMDLLALFASEKSGKELVVEIGAAGGGTTLILSALFASVISVEKFINEDQRCGPETDCRPIRIRGVRNIWGHPYGPPRHYLLRYSMTIAMKRSSRSSVFFWTLASSCLWRSLASELGTCGGAEMADRRALLSA